MIQFKLHLIHDGDDEVDRVISKWGTDHLGDLADRIHNLGDDSEFYMSVSQETPALEIQTSGD